jgi:hypothetical protein
VIIDDTANPLLQRGTTEVYEEPYGLFGEAEIGEQLFRMRSMQLIH